METLETLNERLKEYYGMAWNGMPIYRIVWSDDQLEMRKVECDDKGVELLFPEVREVPKYSHYIKSKYLLEQLVELNDQAQDELKVKINYEPLWVYTDKNDNALPPKWEVTQFVINTVMAARGKSNLAKYIDPNTTIEAKQERIAKIEEELFGNETDVGDALAYRNGVAGFHNLSDKIH